MEALHDGWRDGYDNGPILVAANQNIRQAEIDYIEKATQILLDIMEKAE